MSADTRQPRRRRPPTKISGAMWVRLPAARKREIDGRHEVLWQVEWVPVRIVRGKQ